MTAWENHDPHAQPKLGNTPPGLVAVFTLLTFGLYLPIWYLNRSARLNNLDAARKVNTRAAFALLCLYALNSSGVLSFVGGSDINSALLLSGLGHVLTLASGAILVSLRLRVREILLARYGERFSPRRKSSWLASAVLGEIYLQARMNRLSVPVPTEPSIPVARPAHFQPSQAL